MNERISFVTAQKKRFLNEITSRIAKFKLQGKDLGVFVTIEDDGHLRLPRDFVDEFVNLTSEQYEQLSKKEKAKYDNQYSKSTRYLIVCYNNYNKKYLELFENLDKEAKIELLKAEISTLLIDEVRANGYLNALTREGAEKKHAELGFKGKLSDEQVEEYNQEVSQVKYISQELKNKQNQLEKLTA